MCKNLGLVMSGSCSVHHVMFVETLRIFLHSGEMNGFIFERYEAIGRQFIGVRMSQE